jgi:hypothetical protein
VFDAVGATSAASRLIAVFWSAGEERRGRSCLTRISNQLKTRDALPHLAVYTAAQEKNEHEKVYLEPSFTDTRYASESKKKSRYAVAEIKAAAFRFVDLSRSLFAFARGYGAARRAAKNMEATIERSDSGQYSEYS